MNNSTDSKMQSSTRIASIEVLRVLLMFLIVLYHSHLFGIYKDVNNAWSFILTALITWHVDGFVVISGWFGIKFKVVKWIRLYSVILFYSLIDFIASGHWNFACGWFGASYLLLMLIAPFIDLGVEALMAKPYNERLGYFSLLVMAMVLSWLPIASIVGMGFTAVGISSHSLACIVFLYIVARLFRRSNINIDPRCFLLLAILGYFMMIGIVSCVSSAREAL